MTAPLAALDKIKQFLDGRCYEIHNGSQVKVIENSAEGYAELTCVLKRAVEFVGLKQSDTSSFLFVKNQRSVDGALLIPIKPTAFSVHLIELKKSVDETKWQDIKEQLSCSWLRIKAICGMLDIEVDSVTCYTGYQNDNLSTNPALMKLPLGLSASSSSPASQFLRQRAEWYGKKISIDFWDKKLVTHHRVPLDAAGLGSIALSAP